MRTKPKRKGLKIAVRTHRHRLSDEQKTDLEIMVDWGYSHALIAKKLFGDAGERSTRRIASFCCRYNFSVKNYRNAQSEIGKYNLSRILHGYKLKTHSA